MAYIYPIIMFVVAVGFICSAVFIKSKKYSGQADLALAFWFAFLGVANLPLPIETTGPYLLVFFLGFVLMVGDLTIICIRNR